MSRLARSLVRVAGALVPRSERREWREEWLSELAALERHGADGTPGPVSFALGAFAHALTLRRTSWSWTGLGQDLRWARRSLVRAPGFALGAALTLALGIGANATIFALINGLLLRPPPGLTEPERLVQVARSYEQDPRFDNFSWPAFEVIADETAVFASVGASNQAAFVLGTGDDVEQVPGLYVTGSWFGTLGVRPAVGRLLQPADDRAPGAHPVVVLSHALWTRRFGADPRVVGRTVTIGGEPYEIVGVAAQEFAGTEALGAGPQVWLPAMQTPPMGDRLPFDEWGWSSFDVVARLADGVDLEAASAAMPGLAARLRAAAPVNDGILVLLAEGVGLDPEERAEARRLSGILLLVVGLLLLITCTNVANLFLARAGARQAELGVRAALGAGSGRLARQLLVESLVLAGLATVLALPLVLRAGAVLPALFPWTLSVPVGVDARVLVFLAAVGLATGLFFGAMPAWVTSRRSLAGILRDAGPTSGRRTTRIRDALVVAQLGLSLGLVTGA
ncbi:MAG: ABC transporter permease, partial [Gemmatimonadetes bacterium]|nr:ABC transporter permease [Gemmatimonadota bacterium]